MKRSSSMDSTKKDPHKFDLETLFSEWNSLKKKKAELEDREEQIKKIIHKIMKIENTNSLESDNFKVSRKYQSREFLTKSNVPSDIWSKYSKKSEFPVLYLKKI